MHHDSVLSEDSYIRFQIKSESKWVAIHAGPLPATQFLRAFQI